MGKKSRVQAARKLEEEQLNAKLAEQKNEKKKTTRTVLISVCAFILVLALVFGTIAIVKSSGVLLRNTVAIETEHVKVDNAMLSYFFYNNFYNYLNNNSSAASQLTSSLSLKQQNYSDSLTWFDYIMGRTENDLKSYVLLAEAAESTGLRLDEDDIKQIDEALASLESAASEAGITKEKYITASYGDGVKEEDLRRALELVYLANKKNDEIANSIDFSPEDIANYYSEHKEDFDRVSYKSFRLSATDYYGDENAPDDAEDQISVMATLFGAAKTAEEFDAKVKEYLTAAYKNNGQELTEDALNEKIEETLVTDAVNYSDNFSKWAFVETRKAGDTVVMSEDGVHTAYFITEAPHRLEYTTKNIRQILITSTYHENSEGAKAEAERILAEWKAGEASEASFEELAEKYSEGLSTYYENMTNNSGLAEFDKWIYDESRKPGDADVVESYYGYHVLYFVGDGDAEWEAEVESTMKNEKYNETIENLENIYPITFNTKKYNGLSGKIPTA